MAAASSSSSTGMPLVHPHLQAAAACTAAARRSDAERAALEEQRDQVLAAISACGSATGAGERLAKRLDDLETKLAQLDSKPPDRTADAPASAARNDAAAAAAAGDIKGAEVQKPEDSIDDIADIMGGLRVSAAGQQPGSSKEGIAAQRAPALSAQAGSAPAHQRDGKPSGSAQTSTAGPPEQLPISAADRQVEERVRLKQQLSQIRVCSAPVTCLCM